MSRILCILLGIWSFAAQARIDAPLYADWGKNAEFLMDAEGILTLEEVQAKAPEEWTKAPATGINFGFRKEVYWFRLSLPACEAKAPQRVLEVAYPILDHIELWFFGVDQVPKKFLTGDNYAFSKRPLDHISFGFPYACKKYQNVVLRVKTSSSFQVPIHLWERAAFDRNEMRVERPQFLYFGAIIVMAVYNLFVYFSVRKPTYLLYVLFACSYGTFQAGLSGMGHRFLWPNTPIINDYVIDKSVNCIAFFAFAFGVNFMRTKQFAPRLYRICFILLGAIIVYNFISFLLPYRIAIKIAIVFVVSAISLSFFITATSIRMRQREGYFYGVAWTTFLLGAIILAFNKLGVIPRNTLTENALQISSVVEMLLLSFALADQVNVLRFNLARSNRKLERTLQSIEQIVEQKTQSIRSIMDTLKQGIMTLKGDHFIVEPEYSRYTEVLVGDKNLGGKTFDEVFLKHLILGEDQKSLIRSALMASINEDVDMFQLNNLHLPVEGKIIGPDGEKEIAIDWTPVLGPSNQIERILIAFHDVTELRILKQAQASQSRMLVRLHQLMSADATSLRNFLNNSNRLANYLQLHFQAKSVDNGLEAIKKIFINIHTMKGESRSLGLTELSEECHLLEDWLDSIRKGREKWNADVLVKRLQQLALILKEYSNIYSMHIGSLVGERDIPVKQSVLEQWEVRLKALRPKTQDDRRTKQSLLAEVFGFLHIDLKSYQIKMANWSKRFAKELGKPEPKIILEGEGLYLSHKLSDQLDHVFVHILQNSLVHGIESAEDRMALGKNPAGTIRVDLVPRDNRVLIVVEDDGKGIDINAIRNKAISIGILQAEERLTTEKIEEFLLSSGFSSKDQVTSHAGRGVGMDAIRKFVEEISGQMTLRFYTEQDGFMAFAIVMNFPENLFPSIGSSAHDAA